MGLHQVLDRNTSSGWHATHALFMDKFILAVCTVGLCVWQIVLYTRNVPCSFGYVCGRFTLTQPAFSLYKIPGPISSGLANIQTHPSIMSIWASKILRVGAEIIVHHNCSFERMRNIRVYIERAIEHTTLRFVQIELS